MQLVDKYLACWNETDADARAALLAETFSEQVELVDPLVEVHDSTVLSATIAGVQAQFPGFVFSPVGVPDAHHRVVRFQWGLGPAGGEPVVIGFDVLVTGADGRVEFVAGFFDKVPAVAA
jgi:hypothetical protein